MSERYWTEPYKPEAMKDKIKSPNKNRAWIIFEVFPPTARLVTHGLTEHDAKLITRLLNEHAPDDHDGSVKQNRASRLRAKG